jgi:hypothetical protein
MTPNERKYLRFSTDLTRARIDPVAMSKLSLQLAGERIETFSASLFQNEPSAGHLETCRLTSSVSEGLHCREIVRAQARRQSLPTVQERVSLQALSRS